MLPRVLPPIPFPYLQIFLNILELQLISNTIDDKKEKKKERKKERKKEKRKERKKIRCSK